MQTLYKFFEDLSIRVKLFLSFACLFCLLFWLICAAEGAIKDLEKIQTGIFLNDIPATSDLMLLSQHIQKMRTGVQMLIIIDDTTVKDRCTFELEESLVESEVLIGRLEQRLHDTQTKIVLKRLKELLNNFQGSKGQQLKKDAQTAKNDDIKRDMLRQRKAIFTEMAAISNQLSTQPKLLARERLSLAQQKHSQSLSYFLCVAFGALTITVLLTLFLSHILVRPLQNLTDAARNIAAGTKCSTLIRDGERMDEIGNLAKSFLQMETSLSQRTNELESTLSELNTSNVQLLDLAHEAEAANVKLKAALDSMAEGFCQVDLDGNIIYLNPAAQRILRYHQEDVFGLKFHTLVHPGCENSECDMTKLGKARETDDNFVRKDGTSIPVRFSNAPLSQKNKVLGAVICFRDNSDRAAAELRVKEFYSTVSHELRTPLTSIRGSLGLIEGGVMGEIPSEAGVLIKVARVSCDRLIRLINEILDLSKIESGKLELNITSVCASELVDTAISGVQGAASQSGIMVIAECPEDLSVRADVDRIVQVLTNFLSNAIKFSPAGSIVTVSVMESDWDMVRFSVWDNGPGISQEQIDRLFVRFQQLDSSDTRRQGGTGLGLAISKELVSLHGGKVGLESHVGEGSCFWFEIRTHDDEIRFDELSTHDPLMVVSVS